MPWKTEIDRLVHQIALDAAQGGEAEARRATRAVSDLVALAPEREASHFHAGVLEEILEMQGQKGEADAEPDPAGSDPELPTPEGAALRWRHLGRLDAASRRGSRERVRGLMDDPSFEACLTHPEGRVALRAVGRMLLRDGEDERAFDLYRRHLEAVDDPGSRRDAEFLLEESLRRADRGGVSEEDAGARLARASAFAEAAGLDARAKSKVDRKVGRLQQLREQWDEAATCYRKALDRLPADDPYRSVLVGDLALATLGVRGTLDLLPVADRSDREKAEEILGVGQEGEGRSYNAIYTRGMLAYESGDFEKAAACFGEADRLMRENRAKARIVHARARFFLGHCRLALGAEGEDLEDAKRAILKDAHAVSLDDEVKEPVFHALMERAPDARLPGRSAGRRGSRSEGSRPSAAEHLEAARAALAEDAHQALDLVDRAFKSRPDFETWFGAYRTRLEALTALGEETEALRTLERFRAKLYQREALDRLEGLLLEEEGPLSKLLKGTRYQEELVDLYEVMDDRSDRFVEVCLACAKEHMASDEPLGKKRALAILREASARNADAVKDALAEATAACETAGLCEKELTREEARALLQPEEEPVRLLVVGGDLGRKPHNERFQALAKDLGFEAAWIPSGVRPPYKTLREIEATAEDADAILLHHATGPDLRADVHALSEKIDIPVHEAPWLGLENVEHEVLCTLKEVFPE